MANKTLYELSQRQAIDIVNSRAITGAPKGELI